MLSKPISDHGPRFTKRFFTPAPSPRNIALAVALVFLFGLLILGWNIGQFGIAESYSDPLTQIRAQDESVYTNSAIEMARNGNWLTPTVMGRLFFLKPPMLMWMSALALRLFGWSLLSVRIPALVLGAAGAAGAFAWVVRARSWAAGVLAAGLLSLSPFWQIFSRLNYTDVPASSFALLALVGVVFDPRLERWRTRAAFGFFTAASILTKSVAGALPAAALLLYSMMVGHNMRPRVVNLGKALLMVAVVCAPWHLYQTIAHPQWFWADYVKTELLGIGMNAQRNGIFDRPSWFYLIRMVQMDPLLTLVGAIGIVRAIGGRQKQAAAACIWKILPPKPGAALALAWTAIVMLAMCAFQAKNLPYIVLLVPPLVIVGVVCGPSLLDFRPWLTIAALVAILIAKVAASGAVWSLHPGAVPLEGAHAMRAYYALDRKAELFSVDTDDEFYSSTIPLPRVRYVYMDPAGAIAQSIPHYAPLGIVLTAEQFEDLPELMPRFREHLSRWGLSSVKPVATVITLRSSSDLAALVRSQPQNDFYLPSLWLRELGRSPDAFRVWRYSNKRIFLLSRAVRQRQSPAPKLPAKW